jgi:D-alanyl-D-alanine carboxypeptidase (penicillin-binding protein 5/6)
MIMKRICLLLLLCILCAQSLWAARAKVDTISQDPYISALVIDAATGKILFDDHAETVVYPASVLKLMDLLVILELLEQGKLSLDEMVQVTKEAAQMGGSQVYLDPKEKFSVKDLLYALAIQSANDAAVALAIHVAGSTKEFIALMNRRADELGM